MNTDTGGIKYILPTSQYVTDASAGSAKTELSGISLLPPVQNCTTLNLNAATLPDSDKDKDKIKKIAIYSASGIAIVLAIILLVRTFRK